MVEGYGVFLSMSHETSRHILSWTCTRIPFITWPSYDLTLTCKPWRWDNLCSWISMATQFLRTTILRILGLSILFPMCSYLSKWLQCSLGKEVIITVCNCWNATRVLSLGNQARSSFSGTLTCIWKLNKRLWHFVKRTAFDLLISLPGVIVVNVGQCHYWMHIYLDSKKSVFYQPYLQLSTCHEPLGTISTFNTN